MKAIFRIIVGALVCCGSAAPFVHGDTARAEWTDVAVGTALQGNGATSGVAWGDCDGDGREDIYLSQYGAANQLFHNEGGGIFTPITGETINDTGNSTGAYWGDPDNDGHLDVYLLRAFQSNLLFHNTSNCESQGMTVDPIVDVADVWGAAWVDYDNDGWLDLYASNYNEPNRLMHNNGDGTFSDVPGVLDDSGPTQGCAWADYDNDGDQDLYLVTGSTVSNRLYRNDGQGVFTDVTSGPVGNFGSGQGAAWGDFDNDGDLDLYLTNWGANNRLYRNDGSDVFVDITTAALSIVLNGQSGNWGDYDNDGDLDLYVSYYGYPNVLFENQGGGNFADTGVAYPNLTDSNNSVGSAWSDCDLDGDLDLFVTNYQTDNRLFINNIVNGNHWLHLKLIGTMSNKAAIGARVRIVAGANAWVREVNGGSGYLSQNSLPVEFGLGAVTMVDSVQITWPFDIGQGVNNTSVLTDVAVDQLLTVVEPQIPVSAVGDELPSGYVLHGNYPNPFNPQTVIRFEMPDAARVSLRIYDVAGHLVRTLVAREDRAAGLHEVKWNGRGDHGDIVAAGVYFYRLEIGRAGETRRMTFVK